MVIVKKQHHQEPKWQSHEYPFNIEVPEINYPIAVLGWLDSPYNGDSVLMGAFQSSRDVRKADPKQRGENERVIGQDTAHPWGEKYATTELLEAVDRTKVEDGNNDGEITALKLGGLEEIDQFFDALDYLRVSSKFYHQSSRRTYHNK